MLGIPASVFEAHGSVSAEAASAMAEAARRLLAADLGIGESAIAGPGGASAGKPVGLTYVAVVAASGTHVRECRFAGSRQENREAAVEAALELLGDTIR